MPSSSPCTSAVQPVMTRSAAASLTTPPYDSCAGRRGSIAVVTTQRAQPIAWGGFLLLGWSGLLVPSLVRQIEANFGVDDAAVGVWYFVAASAYAVGSLGGGLLTERFGRRAVLTAGALSVAASWLIAGTSGSWALFTLAAVVGGGAGAIDGGMNGLVLAVTHSASGRALNLLHLFFSVGALAAPLVIGWLVAAGVPWQMTMVATGVAALVVAAAVASTGMPSGKHERPADRSPAPSPRVSNRAVGAARPARGRDRVLCRGRDRSLELDRPVPGRRAVRDRDPGAVGVLGRTRAGAAPGGPVGPSVLPQPASPRRRSRSRGSPSWPRSSLPRRRSPSWPSPSPDSRQARCSR